VCVSVNVCNKGSSSAIHQQQQQRGFKTNPRLTDFYLPRSRQEGRSLEWPCCEGAESRVALLQHNLFLNCAFNGARSFNVLVLNFCDVCLGFMSNNTIFILLPIIIAIVFVLGIFCYECPMS